MYVIKQTVKSRYPLQKLLVSKISTTNSAEMNSGFIHDSTSLDLPFLVVYKKASRFYIAQQLKYKLTLQMQLQAFKRVLVSMDFFFPPTSLRR